MRDNIKKITEKQLLIILFLVLLIASLIVFLTAVLIGRSPSVPLSGTSLTYFGNKESYTLEKIKDYQGVLSTDYYNFSIESSREKNEIVKYTTYIKELENNTIDASDIKVYLTDSKDVPQKDFRIDVNKIVDATGKEKNYYYYDLYTVEIKDVMGDIKESGETKSPKLELYKYYQLNVLNKSLKNPFLVYENDECLSYNLRSDLEEPTLGESCSIKLLPNERDYESYKLVSDQDKVLYTVDATSYKGTYTKIEDSEFKGDVASYIASKRKNQDNKFYIKHITGVKNNKSDKNYSYYTGEVCYEYVIDTNVDGYTLSSVNQIVDLYKCPDDYKIIDYEANPLFIGDLDELYQDEDMSLLTNQITNIIDQNYFIYEDGELIADYNNNYYATDFNKQNKRDYRLRYWIDETSKASADNGFNFRINVVSNK